ncbi:hypothetical protein [Streptomyces sp. 7N604]|uniref:hypothetical protein n=1 Tax=Streptomyces sp. 7N604 TaxID=3457415 RepID=UPI003FD61675
MSLAVRTMRLSSLRPWQAILAIAIIIVIAVVPIAQLQEILTSLIVLLALWNSRISLLNTLSTPIC